MNWQQARGTEEGQQRAGFWRLRWGERMCRGGGGWDVTWRLAPSADQTRRANGGRLLGARPGCH